MIWGTKRTDDIITLENFDTHYSIPEIVRQVAPINGWVRDKTKKYCYFPGTLDPTGYFNPLGFCQLDIITYDVKRCREVEVQHRRVIILVTVDYSLGKVVKGPISITRPTNDQLQQMPLLIFFLFNLGITGAGLKWAMIGWVDPTEFNSLFTFRAIYFPGCIGFDFLELKPTDWKCFANIKTIDLQYWFLAILGSADIITLKSIIHKIILKTIAFHQNIYAGVNSYE